MTPSPSLRSVDLGALLDAQLPARDWLLTPWLREQESALIWAASGVGKTMLTLSLALAIAGGGSVLGWRAPRPARVLIVDGEMPLDDLKDRLTSLTATVEDLDLDAARKNLTILARHHQAPETPFPDFGAEDQQAAVLATIRGYRPDVVILDNLSTLATLDDENGAAETQRVVRLLTRLKQAKIATLVVHHSGKTGKTFRGSSMLATTFEVIIGLTREAGAEALDASGSAHFKIEWTKFRGRRDPTVGDRTAILKETDGVLRWSCSTPEDEVLHALATLARSGRYTTQAAVGQALPEHLWPTPGTPPSTGWISGKFRLAGARGIMPKRELDGLLEAARAAQQGLGDLDPDLHDDI